ncbi:MAG: hypothetical protein R3C28_19025 [Pirellulaceae bacterium]
MTDCDDRRRQPQTSIQQPGILSAISWQQAGTSDAARRVILAVAESHAGETVAFGDRTL